MPFELGLVLGWLQTNRKSSHTWFLFESVKRRISKSLSDLDGTDPYIHDEKPKGVLRELGNALVRNADQPTMAQMYLVYRRIKIASPLIMKNAGAKSLFEARVFRQLVVLARTYVELGRAGSDDRRQPSLARRGR
ncbi:MAG: hypothetical protein WBW33_31145 [Bryobacteraceae bacterium]